MLSDDIIRQYIYDNHLSNDIPSFVLECDEFWSHMRALDSELHAPEHSQRSAYERFVHACGVHWEALGGRILLPEVAGLDLFIARSVYHYTYCRWLALAIEEDSSQFGTDSTHLWRGICNVSKLLVDGIHTRSSLPADFCNVPKGSQYLCRPSAPFERRARDHFGHLGPSECAKIYSFNESTRASCYVLFSPKWALNEV